VELSLQEAQFRLIDQFNPHVNGFSKEANRAALREQVSCKLVIPRNRLGR